MEFLNRILDTLKKPFPDEESMFSYVKKLIAFSLFVVFFLYVFRPFGLDTLESKVFLICIGFGSMTFTGAMIYELSIGQLLRLAGFHNSWTFGKWILNTLITTIFISVANFIFVRLVIIGTMDWSLLPTMMYSTFMIGILPIILLGAWSLFQREKKYKSIAVEINHLSNKKTSISGNSIKTAFDIPIDQIKYIEALQNYVNIAFINPNGELKIRTERLTLKAIQSEMESEAIVKCHRSYLVNKDAIISAAGNAQGLLLSISDCDKIIPVSRTFVSHFRTS